MKLTSNLSVALSFLFSIHPRWPWQAELQVLLNPMTSGECSCPVQKKGRNGVGGVEGWSMQRTLLLSSQKSVLLLLLRKHSDLLPTYSPVLKHVCLKPAEAPFCIGFSRSLVVLPFSGKPLRLLGYAHLCWAWLPYCTVLYCTCKKMSWEKEPPHTDLMSSASKMP